MYTKNREAIMEIKRGHTGTGLLIENDGYIVGNNDTIRQIKEDIEHHDKFVIPDKFVVSAVFQKYGIKNANGRIYPEAILKREVEKYINDRVRTRGSIGALDHPSQTTLSGHDVSHIITNLEWVGQTLIGEMELHLTPGYRRYGIASTSGDLVANMLLDNIHVGVSSRGVGTVEDKYGVMMVGDEYELLCWDVVMEPSSPGAWIGMDRNELQQYVESDQSRNDKPIVTEKIQRIKQILV